MGRTGRRISRSLIGVLIVTLVLGLVFFLKHLSKTEAEPAQMASAPIEEMPVQIISVAKPAPATPTTEPLMTMTPSSTQPAQIAMDFATAQPAPATPKPAPTPAPTASASGSPLADAQAKQQAGDLLGARTILNDALLAGNLSDTGAIKKALADINQTVVFSPKKFPGDEFGGAYTVQSGDRLTKIATQFEVPWEALLRFNGMTDPTKLRAGQSLKVIHGPFNAVVTKGKFTLDLYLGPPGEKGSMYVTTYPVGLGKQDSTPTGTWLVEAGKKLKKPTYYNPRGEGPRVIPPDDPTNPLGTRWIGLTGIDGKAIGQESYGVHGTIDDNSVGKQESMGCIRMHNTDVELVFDLLVEGKSLVLVKD